ncbi:MAG: hypothetical protein A2Y62_04775 [Candidatus Fischerbacteria bacterium RBG_13_37_8]|uniref:Peptidase M14 domain-containing protein n=1 Tax=Candidatus Fischerbacteria bacterium RBG_13_37_8 TaxID=1817863 RepID=A0A1F5VHS5_9BACT|nr:MAG: hypothetical protein A2Y62_04775 [Candidatus Fischerbacteria bacterium RBG_13_37_8]
MKKYLATLLLITCFAITAFAQLQTVAEQSDYARTSLYSDVMNFIYQVQKKSPLVKVVPLATTTEGRMIPMVVLSKENISRPVDLRIHDKPVVLIMANIHAGEVEGKEACQMLIRDIASGKIEGVLDNQVLLFIPIFNADGNDKLGHNRRDNGPELAGVRHNGQKLDLNRDYVKLETPEVKGLIRAYDAWDPVLLVDMHTTNGSYHREPVTYTPGLNPNGDQNLADYMWKEFFPTVSATLKTKYGYDSVPYGNFVDRLAPEKGWENDSYEARFGTNYISVRNRFAILDENYSYADYKTRVLASYSFIRSILEFTNQNIKRMRELVRKSDIATASIYHEQLFTLEYKPEKTFNVTVKSYVFENEKIKPEDRSKYPPWIGEYIAKKTDTLKDYAIPYFASTSPVRTTKLPAGYIILPYQDKVLENLLNHGISVEKILEPFTATLENFKITKIENSETLFQGHIFTKVEGAYETAEVEIPADSYYVSMNQPLARLIAVLLEPEHSDSLLSWGFFDRVIIEQWTNRPSLYPVYRITARPSIPMLGIGTGE